jgi:uncharacterized protein (DUF1810 family)
MAFDLERFVTAQAPVYAAVCDELADGRKASHWMWFVFPQLRALGRSATAKFFGIESLDEARAYAAHPLLGARLRECAQRVLDVQGRSAHQIFGSPDDLKLCSCMTLFEAAAPVEPVFEQVLERYFDGVRDHATLALLRTESGT